VWCGTGFGSEMAVTAIGLQLAQNVGDECSESNLAGVCSGLFENCATKQNVQSCAECPDKNCFLDTETTHCFNAKEGAPECICKFPVPPPRPAPEQSSNAPLVVGVVMAIVTFFLIVVLVYTVRKQKGSYAPVQ